MQTKKLQLQRQQIIMSQLGFYKHKCDGIWGPDSIAAKRGWETSRSFIPALPTNGLPFGERDPVPKGMYFDKASRLFVLTSMTPEDVESFMPVVETKPPVVQVEEDSVPETEVPVVETPVENAAAEDVVRTTDFGSKKNKHRR